MKKVFLRFFAVCAFGIATASFTSCTVQLGDGEQMEDDDDDEEFDD